VLEIVIDAAHGGGIVSLREKQTGFEFCLPAEPLGIYRACLCAERRFASSSESAAAVRVLEQGPLRVKLEMTGSIGPVRFVQTLAVGAADRLLDVEVRFDFGDGIEIGDPDGVARMTDAINCRCCCLPPSGCAAPRMLLLTSVRAPTRTLSSNSWDDYKHHVLLNWVDRFDAGQDAGLAILVDRTSGYLHGQQHPLGLILVTGREEARPVGTETRRFTLMPHRGDWQQAACGTGPTAGTQPGKSPPSAKHRQSSSLWMASSHCRCGRWPTRRWYLSARRS